MDVNSFALKYGRWFQVAGYSQEVITVYPARCSFKERAEKEMRFGNGHNAA
jgi:hypothetical protein